MGGSGNPVLDEISVARANLSPQAQQAIEGAHEKLGISPAHSDPALTASTANPELSVPGVSGPRGPLPILSPEVPTPSQPVAATGGTPMADSNDMAEAALDNSNATFAADHARQGGTPMVTAMPSAAQREYSRLTAPPLPGSDPNAHTAMDAGRPGVQQIHNPWLRGLATAGDVIGSGLFPRLGQFVPGLSAYHNRLVGEEGKVLGEEQASAKNAADLAKSQAETNVQNSLPELHKTQAELAQEKIANTQNIAGAKQETANAKQALAEAEAERKRGESQQKIAAGLAEHGLKMDPETKELVPIPYAEMSETQKAVHDLKGAQTELTEARKAYVQAQKDGIPAAQDLARKRVAAAQESAATAAGRLGLSRDEFNAEFLGTAPGGEALAGAEVDASGKPIGTKVAAGNKPNATVAGRAAQAGSVIEAGNNLKAEIDANKDKLGNLGSYWNQAVNGTPIADKEVSKLMAEIASYAALQPAMHGMRGGTVMKEFEKMIGGVPKDPEALKAAIDGVAATAGVVQHQGGQPHNQSQGATPTVTSQQQFDALPKGAIYIEDGKQFRKP